MYHLLIHIIKKEKIHIDILSHFNSAGKKEWYGYKFDGDEVNVDPTRKIGFSSNGRVLIIITHSSSNYTSNEQLYPEICENTIHYKFLTGDIRMIDYINEFQIIENNNNYEVILSDGENVVFTDYCRDKKLDDSLYLYCYLVNEVPRIILYFDGWLLNLLDINRKYDENIRQILLRVGSTKQFNQEDVISKDSKLMLIFIRGREHSIYDVELLNGKCKNYTFKDLTCFVHEEECEKYEMNPEILVNFDNYGSIYKEYKLRFTFLPFPTSIKTVSKAARREKMIRNKYSAYNLYSKDIRCSVEEYYTNQNEVYTKDEISKFIGERWKLETYDEIHRYEMYAYIDRIRFNDEKYGLLLEKPEFKNPYDKFCFIVNEEKDFIKREELVSKVCHFKQIFSDHQKKGDTDINGPFVMYYHERFSKLFSSHPNVNPDKIGEIIYNEFYDKIYDSDEEIIRLKKKCYVKLNKENLTLINDNVIKYLPKRVEDQNNYIEYREIIEIKKKEEIEELSDSNSNKRRHEDDENDYQVKCRKLNSDRCNDYPIENIDNVRNDRENSFVSNCLDDDNNDFLSLINDYFI